MEQWTGNPRLVDIAARLIRDHSVAARDERGLVRAVQRLAQTRVKYWREAPERWQSPLRTLEWGIGDCDDLSILIASILRSFRIPTRLRFVRFTKKDGSGSMSHVYPQAKIENVWTSIESVRAVPLGFDFETHARAKGIAINATEVVGDK